MCGRRAPLVGLRAAVALVALEAAFTCAAVDDDGAPPRVAVVGWMVVDVVVVDARLAAGFAGTISFLVPLEGLAVGVGRSASNTMEPAIVALLGLARADVCGGAGGVEVTSAGGGRACATPAEGDMRLRVGERVGVDTMMVGSC